MIVASPRSLGGSLALVAAVFLAGCGDGSRDAPRLTGAGASFPNPIYTRWFDEYHRATGVQINYQSIGSGGGIRQFSQGTVDFGATDGPMTDAQIAAIDGNVLHIPTVVGAVVLTYNLPSPGDAQLSLDGETIADIFLGRITKWNDRRIAALNAGVALPDEEILVVHRSDGSGTTFVFTDYLSKVSPVWAQDVGAGKSVNWPVGLGGKGNEGVTQQVKQLVFTIGYVELIYALSNDLAYATIVNSAGNGVVPTLATASEAAGSAEFTPDTDFRVSITNADGERAYPITSFTWLLVRQDDDNRDRAQAIQDFLEWMTSEEAQAIALELRYAPLPPEVLRLVKTRTQGLTSGGQPLE